MNGQISITESLKQRLNLLKAHKDHSAPLIELLRSQVSDSFKTNKEFLKVNAANIYIVSNGFIEIILPVVSDYGMISSQVFGNKFTYDDQGFIIGFDTSNVLSSENGKVKLVVSLQLTKDCVVIGDGFTDYEIKAAGLAKIFYAFTENISRDLVTSKTPYIAPTLDYVIRHMKEQTLLNQQTLTRINGYELLYNDSIVYLFFTGWFPYQHQY